MMDRIERALVARRLHRAADLSSYRRQVCYFIGAEVGPVKIGYSQCPSIRLAQLQRSSPVPLSILAAAYGGKDRERAYHFEFAEFRLHNEWFERDAAIISEIEKLPPIGEQRPAYFKWSDSFALQPDRYAPHMGPSGSG